MARVLFTPVPGVQAQIQAPNDYQRIDSSPAMFGGLPAQAEERGGGQLDQAGGALMQTAMMRQGIFNQVATDDGVNKFQDGTYKLTYGDPNDPTKPGIYGLRGQDALNAGPSTIKAIDNLRQQIRDGLQNDFQRHEFDQASRRLQMYTASEIGRHLDQQADNYAVATNQATEANSIRAIGAGWSDETGFQNNLADGKRAAVRGMQAQHGQSMTNDLANAAANDFQSKAITARTEAWAANDPTAALSWLQTQQSKVDPNTYQELTRRFGGQRDDVVARGALNRAWPGSMPGAVSSAIPPGGDDAVATAIRGQEGSGSGSVSVNGAQGQWQITPATFAQYAKPGEDIKNPADNEAVGRRIIGDYSQRYDGDPGRIAVAYFSGPGNVAPAGSATPYLEDKKDGNGTSTSAYVAGVMSRLGGAPGQSPSAAFAPAGGIGGVVDKLMADPTLSSEQRDKAISYATRRYHEYEQATENDRAALRTSISSGAAALENGQDYTWDEGQIRTAFPGPEADRYITGLQDAKLTGQATISAQSMAPADIAVKSQQIADSLANGNDPDYAGKQKIAIAWNKALAVRQQGLSTDPASYVLQTSPVVRAASAAIDPNNPDPQKLAAYAQASLAEQVRLGVPAYAQHILSLQQAQDATKTLMNTDPTKGDVGQQLAGMAQRYGANWPQVFGDMVTLGKLPREFQTLAAIPDPTTRIEFQRALAASAAKGGMARLRDDVPPSEAKAIDNGLDDQLRPFSQTARDPQLISTVRDSVRELSYFYALQGMAGPDALQRATNGIVNARYDFDGTMRVPKGSLPAARAAGASLVDGLKAADLAPLAADTQATAAGPGLTEAQRQEITLRAVQRWPQWITNENDTGLILTTKTSDGATWVVRHKDGSRIDLPFSSLARAVGGQPAPDYVSQAPPMFVTAGPQP